jgi:hypothetical protein
MIENGHAEIAQPFTGSERWYLPFFGVYHPKKPGKVRVVFDSSAKFAGVSYFLKEYGATDGEGLFPNTCTVIL